MPFMDILLEQHPEERIFNVGNPESVTIADWVRMCYDTVGAPLEMVNVKGHPQRSFFCFHDYDYRLDVTKQMALMPWVKPLAEGLKESYEWFRKNRETVMRRPYVDYIDAHILSVGSKK
jgi:nucleoside-diphosphate-sugar epimerase